MRYAAVGLLVTLLALTCILPAHVQEPRPPEEPLAEKVKIAIERGVEFLRGQEEGRGDLEKNAASRLVTGGWTALAALALLNSGVSPDDPLLQRLLKYLRTVEPNQTYVVGLQTMVFALAGQGEDKERIQRNVDWLISARILSNKDLLGWNYGRAGVPDNSNTQYALLGLHEGFLAGAEVKPEIWESILKFYQDTMQIKKDARGAIASGSWGYRRSADPTTFTMTTAGVCGLLIAQQDLKASRMKDPPDCDTHCGKVEDDEHLRAALDWLAARMPRNADDVSDMRHLYYALYGIERAGRLSGQRFIGEVDWYRVGCEYLVRVQRPDGSWVGGEEAAAPILGTSFALLFLSKGRTPVLISKIAHDPDEDWNLHRYDARNLADFCSRELFKKQPLAWQVFDPRRAGDLTRQRIDELTSDLLQSPVAYLSGNRAPRLGSGERTLLRNYLDNGGFLLAEACCGSAAFDTGFKDMLATAEMYPDAKLTRLDADHPVWLASGKFAIDPSKHELWGLSQGCKTVIIYSPKGRLGCWWDSNYTSKGKPREAFELGANIIAYATGLEAPKPRLTQVDVLKVDAEKKTKRGYLKVAQVRHEGDWQPAPRAMSHLMAEMRKLGYDVALQTEEIRPGDRSLPDFRFLYLHGRNQFNFSDAEAQKLRFHLETGGMLLADACCGSKKFDESFRKLIGQIWPGKKLEPIPLNDELYSAELNGSGIATVKCRREGPVGKRSPELRSVPPSLEGIKVNGRWVVIWSRYDLGCALEKHQSPECLGHDHDSALRLARAVVLYAMKR